MEAIKRFQGRIQNELLTTEISETPNPPPQWYPCGAIGNLVKDNEDVRAILQEAVRSHDDADVEALKEFTLKKAKRLFALLVKSGKLQWLNMFCSKGFGGDCFPVNRVGSDGIIQVAGPREKKFNLVGSSDDDLELFCSVSQWKHALPYIKEVRDAEGLELKTNNSLVKRIVVYQSHLKFPRGNQIGTVCDENGNPHIAVKELASARGGNLRHCWKVQPSLSHAAPNLGREECSMYLRWFFHQLVGIADAIKCLHHPENNTGVSCGRHGDLKSENILCFASNEASPGEIPKDVQLVVADAGHPRFTKRLRSCGGNQRRHQLGQKCIAPAEAETPAVEPRSRRYDIWSLGCLFFESLIWILYGSDRLEEFHVAVETGGTSGTYYGMGPSAGLRDVVKNWIAYIREDPRCSGLTALGRLLGLIETRLLVSKVSERTTSFSSSQQDGRGTPDTAKPRRPAPIPGVVISRPTVCKPDTTPEGADAKEMCRELEKIYKAAKEGTVPWINQEGVEEAGNRAPLQISSTLTPHAIPANHSTPSILLPQPSLLVFFLYLTVPKKIIILTGRAVVSNVKLCSPFRPHPDGNIARLVVLNGTGTAHENYGMAKRCSRCSKLEIWSSTCEFSDTLAELGKQSQSCDLCRLLPEEIVKRAARNKEMINFFGFGSYLTFGERHWSPILSLCTQAEHETLSSSEVQLGLPSLSHIKILSEWIQGCNDSQHLPADSDFVPTRLLAVGDETSRRVRLVCNFEGKVKYVALSHRWGGKDQTRPAEVLFEQTNRHTIEKIKEPKGIPETHLPQTFLDAVTTTRKLKVKYLWIDSLCILQKAYPEDEEGTRDWNFESNLMEKVYSSAYFTIAASCAEHGFDGFLKTRKKREVATMSTENGGKFHVCEIIDSFNGDVEQGEPNKRGWVLRERALSRRTIHFTANQTYWDQPEATASSNQTSTGTCLWRRQWPKPTLKRIDFKRDGYKVPSWSWMALEGEIRYMNVAFGDIKRADDIVSPIENIPIGSLSYTDAASTTNIPTMR
ncbi:HET-domain-containing protein [Zalerion maritima]|uniref:HET-domain-containing protein n=1 Tax=Zalerion maritima TaxID=339359 RepID=A0AAD5WQV4_9PEZI|nr:HET-domain-containing protein [Zalerion maritima]